MPVEIDIAHVARLARLDLTAEELDGYRHQLGAILEHAASVQTLKSDVPADNSHPLGLVNQYREDVRRPSLDRDEVLGQAPKTVDGYFAAPPALEME